MNLTFEFDDRVYDLQFNRFNIICIIGDSAVGKSLMCDDMRNLRDYDPSYRHIKVFDVFDEDYLTVLRDEQSYKKYSTFIIDNADLLVTEEVSNIISSHPEIYWILLGRRIPSCVLSLTCIGTLVRDGNTFKVDYNRLI